MNCPKCGRESSVCDSMWNGDALVLQSPCCMEIAALKAQILEREAERDEAVDVVFMLVDAHYGASYHHIADGDGLVASDKARIMRILAQKQAQESGKGQG